MKIKAGDPVHFKPEFQDKGDDQFKRYAVEDESGGRVLIETIIPGMEINPTEIVQVSMLELGL